MTSPRPSRPTGLPSALRPAAWLLVALAIAGCGTARVYRDRAGVAADRALSLAGSRVPAPLTAQVLDEQGMTTPLGLVDPGRAADALRANPGRSPDVLYAVADLRSKQARRAEASSPDDAPGLYLDAVEAASQYLAMRPPEMDAKAPPDPREQEGRKVYNRAVEGFLRSSAGSWMKFDKAWSDKLAARGIRAEFRRDTYSWNPEAFDHFYFTQDYRVLGIRNSYRSGGLGVPLIAQRRTPPFALAREAVGPEKFYPRRLKAYPATAVLRVGRDASSNDRLVLIELVDSMRTTRVEFEGVPRPMANDLTTPLSFYFTSLPLPKLTQVGTFRPGILEKQAGLYLLHPYEPGKIPVILIHGLWSSPDTWHQALNDLRGDPSLRDRYQFLVYFYPTGDPFLYSASELRKSLADFRHTFDPAHQDPACDQTVLIGHSMGGLLSRLMVVDSGTAFWDSIATRPFADMKAGPGQRAEIEDVFFFDANPSIGRVVYIATPHKGSSLSGAFIGRLGNALIQLPTMFEDMQKLLREQNPPDFFREKAGPSPATSITQLSPKSTALAAMADRPLPSNVPMHSIIAKATPGPLPTSSDLVVAYGSSHLPEAVSEHIVDDNHSCVANPRTIAEIRRILYLHLEGIDQGRAEEIGRQEAKRQATR